ncbi:MAG: hypothetical protein ABJM06_03245 [Gilvibacter sp.]
MKVLTIDKKTNTAIIKTQKLWLTLVLVMGIMFMAGYGLGNIIAKLFL